MEKEKLYCLAEDLLMKGEAIHPVQEEVLADIARGKIDDFVKAQAFVSEIQRLASSSRRNMILHAQTDEARKRAKELPLRVLFGLEPEDTIPPKGTRPE